MNQSPLSPLWNGIWRTLGSLGYLASGFFLLCVFFSGFSFFVAASPKDYKLYGVLMLSAALLFLVCLILLLCKKARIFATILAGVGSAFTLLVGGLLVDLTNGSIINDDAFTFTETSTFWLGHALPPFIFLFALAVVIYHKILQAKIDSAYYHSKPESTLPDPQDLEEE